MCLISRTIPTDSFSVVLHSASGVAVGQIIKTNEHSMCYLQKRSLPEQHLSQSTKQSPAILYYKMLLNRGQ